MFLDGPKSDKDALQVSQVRDSAHTIKGFKSVTLIEMESNRGLADSIVGGVTKMLDTYSSVIVLEDDIVTSPCFLEFMNAGLEIYNSDPEVASIHGFIYTISNLPETFFMKGADCWGWATWRRAWQAFCSDGKKLLSELEERSLINAFDHGGACANTQMLRDQVAGLNDSWAIRWHASAFLRDMLTLHPGRTLVCNIGLDGSGTHCNQTQSHLMAEPSVLGVNVIRQSVTEDSVAVARFAQYLQSSSQAAAEPKNFFEWMVSKLKTFLFSR